MKTKTSSLSADGKTLTKTKTVIRGGKTKVKTTTLTDRGRPGIKLFDRKVTKVKTKKTSR